MGAAQDAACAACDGSCGVCPYVTARDAAPTPERVVLSTYDRHVLGACWNDTDGCYKPAEWDEVLAVVERLIAAERAAHVGLRAAVASLIDDHGDCFDGQPIHQTVAGECVDDCPGCCADELVDRLRAALAGGVRGE